MSHSYVLKEFEQEFYDRIGFRPSDRELLIFILKEIHDMSVTLQQLQADLAAEGTDLAQLSAAVPLLVQANAAQATLITSLQAQIQALQASGGASASDLAGLDTTINTDATQINTLTAAVNAALNPPPAAVAAPSTGS